MRLTRPRPPIKELYRLLWRMQITRGRLIGLGVLGSITILIALLGRGADDVNDAALGAVAGYGLGVVAAISAVWVATSTLGNLVEDGLLVYLWTKPTDRWLIPIAALAASLSVLAMVVLVPVSIAAAVTEVDGLVTATIAAVTLSLAAYSSLFVALGLAFRRALWWGLAYILIWENVIARVGSGTARFSILSYGQSIIARAADTEPRTGLRSSAASWIVPIVVTVAGMVFATRRLDRAEID